MNKFAYILGVLLLIVSAAVILPKVSREKAGAAPAAAPLTGVAGIAAGFGHTIAIKDDRTVHAWGRNNLGQLGDGTTENRDTAVQVPGLTDIVAVAAGGEHSLALAADGTLWAWGSNEIGQLGTGGALPATKPSEIRGVGSLRAIAAGDNFSLAVKRDGSVIAWGANDRGQLGTGETKERGAPSTVQELTGVAAVAAGRSHAAALREDGTVWTWGANDQGQLGDSTTNDRTRPVQVRGLTGVLAVACGYDHTLAIMADGTIMSWGANDSGQLGDGTTESRRSPVPVAGIADGTAIAAGHRHSASLLKNGTVAAWGSNRHYQLMRHFLPLAKSPLVLKTGQGPAAALASGGYHLLVIADDRTVFSWGHNKFGQLGNSTTDYQRLPAQALVLPRGASLAKKDAGRSVSGSAVVMTAVGRNHSVALLGDGTVWAWGDNFYGQLGNVNRRVCRSLPQPVDGIANVTAVAAGSGLTLALKGDGTVWSWGNNTLRQLGDGTTVQSRWQPVQVAGLKDIIGIAARDTVCLAVKKDGTVWTWGLSFIGSPNAPSPPPALVPGLMSIAAVAAGEKHFLALGRDGTVWSWGNNHYGQLGDGTTAARTGVVRVSNIHDVVAIAAGGGHSVAVKKDGTVWAWGRVIEGESKEFLDHIALVPLQHSVLRDIVQVAAGAASTVALKRDGTPLNSFWRARGPSGSAGTTGHLAVAVSSLSDITHISVGPEHELAVKKDGTVWSWGTNECGQLGDGSDVSDSHGSLAARNVYAMRPPGQVREFSIPSEARTTAPAGVVAALSAGGAHSALLMADGTVWTWGDNAYHQLGKRSDRKIKGKTASATSEKERPFALAGQATFKAVDAGQFHTLAVMTDGTVIEWGRSYDDQAYEQKNNSLSTSDWIQHNTSLSRDRGKPGPAMNGPVGDLVEVSAVSSGSGFSLALKQDGTVWAWGLNNLGQLGDGTTVNRKVPKPVAGLKDIVAISAGDVYSLALQGDGTVWAWGATAYKMEKKMLTPQIAAVPAKIPDLADVTAVAAGFEPLVLLRDGSIHSCWQKLRPDPKTIVPFKIQEVGHAQAISSKGMRALVLGTDGRVAAVNYSWKGSSDSGMEPVRTVEQVEDLSEVVALSAGVSHSLAMTRDGSLWVWGDNGAGQLGDASHESSTAPIPLRFP